MEVEVVQETPLTPHSEHSYSKVLEKIALLSQFVYKPLTINRMLATYAIPYLHQP